MYVNPSLHITPPSYSSKVQICIERYNFKTKKSVLITLFRSSKEKIWANNKEHFNFFPLLSSSKYSSLQLYSHETDLIPNFRVLESWWAVGGYSKMEWELTNSHLHRDGGRGRSHLILTMHSLIYKIKFTQTEKSFFCVFFPVF